MDPTTLLVQEYRAYQLERYDNYDTCRRELIHVRKDMQDAYPNDVTFLIDCRPSSYAATQPSLDTKNPHDP